MKIFPQKEISGDATAVLRAIRFGMSQDIVTNENGVQSL
jgi:hypothetical protein